MKRDPDTDAPNFWAFARDYLHVYLLTGSTAAVTAAESAYVARKSAEVCT